MKSALAALLLAAGALARCAEPPPRAIWTWEPESYAMLEQASAAAEAIGFLRAQNIGTIFLYADAWHGRNLIAARPALYHALLRRMHGAGLRVYALLGSGYLHTERYVLPEHRAAALTMLRRVLDYNRAAAPEERFDGVNLDIEPHILDEWDTRRDALLAQYLDLSAALMEERRRAGATLPVGPAIPFWLDGIELTWQGRRRPVSEHVQDLYDYVALMDYRDHAAGPDGMLAHAEQEMAYAQRAGRRVLIGVETAPNEIEKVSFHHLAPPDLERELGRAATGFGASPAFGGFVLHHYGAYRAWLQRYRTGTNPP